MAYSVWSIPNLEQAQALLKGKRLADDPRTYVFSAGDTLAWVALLANGHKFDFNKSYVRVVPE